MIVFGLDPGPDQAGFVVYDTTEKKVLRAQKGWKFEIEAALFDGHFYREGVRTLVIEYVDPRPTRVGYDLADTIRWTGYIEHVWKRSAGYPVILVPRHRVKVALSKASGMECRTDAQVIAALKYLVGDKGTKKNPGRTYGVTADCWQALAVVVAWEHGAEPYERKK